jgi:hypothetical protein
MWAPTWANSPQVSYITRQLAGSWWLAGRGVERSWLAVGRQLEDNW